MKKVMSAVQNMSNVGFVSSIQGLMAMKLDNPEMYTFILERSLIRFDMLDESGQRIISSVILAYNSYRHHPSVHPPFASLIQKIGYFVINKYQTIAPKNLVSLIYKIVELGYFKDEDKLLEIFQFIFKKIEISTRFYKSLSTQDCLKLLRIFEHLPHDWEFFKEYETICTTWCFKRIEQIHSENVTVKFKNHLINLYRSMIILNREMNRDQLDDIYRVLKIGMIDLEQHLPILGAIVQIYHYLKLNDTEQFAVKISEEEIQKIDLVEKEMLSKQKKKILDEGASKEKRSWRYLRVNWELEAVGYAVEIETLLSGLIIDVKINNFQKEGEDLYLEVLGETHYNFGDENSWNQKTQYKLQRIKGLGYRISVLSRSECQELLKFEGSLPSIEEREELSQRMVEIIEKNEQI